MSGRRSISNSFNVITVDDPVSVIAQYAPTDNPSSSQIHDTWQNGDLYMRTKSTEDGATWSSWHKIVGESGDETDYTFGISAYKTTSNASTAPSDISSWSDAPLAVTSAKPYLWAKVQKKSWNASTQSYDVDSTTYIRLTGEDGSSVMAQYAPNNNPSSSQIHDTWQSGDLYMRTKSTSDSNWSSWHKIVGESGDETDYSFNISKSKTSTNPTTAPSDCYYQTWQDAPVAPTSTYPYMWMKIVKKTWNESTQSYDSGTPSYARVTGEKGDDGVSYCFVFTKAAARVNEDNIVTAELAGYAYKYVGGVRSALTSTTIRYGYILNDSSTYADTTTNDSGFFDAGTWFNDDDITGYGKNSPSIFAAIVIGGTVVHSEMITISIKGRTGSRGKVGRFFYYAGAFNVSDNTTQFLVNDAQSPYFSYNNQYWVYNPEYNPSGGTTTMSAMGTPSSSSSNWKIMTNDFKYIITEAIFGSYAHFGSAIINGDWLLSTNGTINGVAYNNGALYNGSPAYTWFDPQYPNESVNTAHSVNGKEWTGYNFVPNYAVDLLTGKSYQNEAYIKGQIVATSGSIDSITATNLNIKSGTITGDVTIGDDGVNIKLRPTGSGSGVGASIVAYDGTLTPFSLLFDRYSYSGTYYPHATLKLESAAPYLSKYGKIEIKDTESKRTLYYGSSQIPDYTYTLYEGFESITNFTGFVSKFSVNNAYHLRIGITRTGVAYIIADAMPTANDVSNIPTGCFYREGNTLKIKI